VKTISEQTRDEAIMKKSLRVLLPLISSSATKSIALLPLLGSVGPLQFFMRLLIATGWSLSLLMSGCSPLESAHDVDSLRVGARPMTVWLEQSRLLFDECFGSLWFRKAYHFIAGGVLVAAIASLPTPWFRAFCLLWLGAFGFVSRRVSTSVLGLLLLNVLSGSRIATLGTAVIFVIGDGLAAVMGRALGTRKLPWREDKTVVGSLAFFVGASLAMLGFAWTVMHPTPGNMLLLSVLPSLAGCLAEALPFTLIRDIRDAAPDDNLPVVLSSGAVLHALLLSLR
jgi:dolichol kinase